MNNDSRGSFEMAGYVMMPEESSGKVSLDTSGLQFKGGTAVALRFTGGQMLLNWGSISLRSGASILRLSTDSGDTYFDWPLPFSLEDRTHVATLVLYNKLEAAVYLDGNFLFSRPTTAEMVTGSSGNATVFLPNEGEIRLYGRPLTAPEARAVSGEVAPDMQYFTLTQESAVPELSKASALVPAAGATVQTELGVPTGVPWTATSTLDWLQFIKSDATVSQSISGTGPTTISVSVMANNTTEGREGVVTIANLEFHVTQLGRTVNLIPLSAGMTKYGQNVNAVVRESGGALLLGVQPEANVGWTIRYANSQDASWIVPNPATSTGNKDVLFALSPYNSPLAARTAVFGV